MDALSDVLSVLKVRSGLSSRFEGAGAWAFRFPAYQHMKFGTVLQGRLYLRMDGDPEFHAIDEGDFYLLTNGAPFRSASVPECAPLDGPATYRSIRDADGIVRFRGPGSTPPVALASGRFVFDSDVTDMLLGHLPPLIHLRAADVAAHALSHVLALLRIETGDPAPGADIAKTSLATLVLVQTLRAYIASGARADGWLSALSDPKVGAALSVMHGSPERRWTIATLASSVGMSRTAFATRFRRMVGSAPLEYLQQWRMAIAKTALKDSDEPLVSIAERIGYLSDTAFSIAFKRTTGISPGRYRIEQRGLRSGQAAVSP
ncbi:AraC family transcriptional regulator [Burkholderia stabilis]|uniref:Transcriptional regulator, AraC family n=1 Tax=Burkholderia stabilis TaxID=95485 RepID=A0AAJ5T8L2_9BURK|nr:AraC family transcriptional regulator [Burkholderia stabilis]VBB16685.1 putative transcriptional regulator, AraC family [Burkholderia stabilis]